MRSTSLLALAAFAVPTTPLWANDDPWALLAAIEVDEIISDTSYTVKKTYPDAIRNGAQEFRITGYAVPMFPGVAGRDLLLVSDMGDCPFCGQPDHGASLQIQLDEDVLIEEGQRELRTIVFVRPAQRLEPTLLDDQRHLGIDPPR